MHTVSRFSGTVFFLTLAFCVLVSAASQTQSREAGQKPTGVQKPSQRPKPIPKSTPNKDPGADQEKPAPPTQEELEEELDVMVVYKAVDRIEKLKEFLSKYKEPSLVSRANELLVSARAAHADEMLRATDAKGGIDLFRLAIREAPPNISDKLFAEVIAQIPLNLFLRGQREAAIEIARLIEVKINDDPRRLLTLAGFFLTVEDSNEAIRISDLATKIAPQMAATHLTLGTSYHIGLQLEQSASEYARAVELDPKSLRGRRSLADLRRATGKPEEAVELYTGLLKDDPTDKASKNGLVIALLDAGKKEDAERELASALADDPRNLPLLVGAAYWFTAHGDATRGFEYAQRAVSIEPRYTWGQIALARSLIGIGRPLDAESVLRYVRQYGRFPTIDYELGNAIASAGLYEDSAVALQNSFKLKDGLVETLLAGHLPARSESFLTLLAPERQAGIYQPTAADSESNARVLKGLLAFYVAMNPQGGASAIKEGEAIAAAQEFTSGDDAMRTYRQLYVANTFLHAGIALQAVLDFTDAAMVNSEAALDVPTAAIAMQSDVLADVRAQALKQGKTLSTVSLPKIVLSNILRGRIEDTAGWALYNQNKPAEAAIRLRRAAGILPPNTVWWSSASWHLGVALEAAGDLKDALNAYMRSYSKNPSDASHRLVIDALYQKVYGSLDGIDERIKASGLVAKNVRRTDYIAPPPNAEPTSTPSPDSTGQSSTPQPSNTEPGASPTPAPTQGSSPIAVASPTLTPTSTPTPDATPEPTAKTQASPEVTTASSPTPIPEPSPSVAASPTPNATPQVSEEAKPSPSPSIDTTPTAIPTPTAQASATASPSPESSTPATSEPPALGATTRSRVVKPIVEPTPSPSPAGPELIAKNEPPPSPTPTPPPPEVPPAEDRAADCSIKLSSDLVTIKTNGGSAKVTVTLPNRDGPSDISANTDDWADISIFVESNIKRMPGAVTFRVTSVNIRPGSYTVVFKSPCGSKKLTVVVQ
jgi:tetratricopeptide (TPR) repeat protein